MANPITAAPNITGGGVREDLYEVNVTFNGTDGKKVAFVFDKMTGGGFAAKETKYRPANGVQVEQTIGGSVSASNITVSRLYQADIDAWVKWLLQQTGKATMQVAKQPLDSNGAPLGQPLLYNGILNSTTPPPTDSMSDSAAIIECECSTVTTLG